MDYRIKQVRGLDCPSKYLIVGDNKELCFVNSKSIAQKSVSYLLGNKDVKLDTAKKRFLDRMVKLAG